MVLPAALAFLANPAFWAGAGKVASIASTGASIFKGFGASGGDGGGEANRLGLSGDFLPPYSEDPLIGETQKLLLPAGQRFLSGDPGFDLPSYGVSPYYTRGQEALAPLGEGLLTGRVPSFLKPISEPGGAEFEDVLKLTTRDVTRGVREDLAKRGIKRGGIGTSAIAKSIADVTSRLRFDDLLRSIEGKKVLLGAGIDIAGGTRASGLEEAQMRNLFGLDLSRQKLGIRELGLQTLGDVRGTAVDTTKLKSAYQLEAANLELKRRALEEEIALKEQERSGSIWSNILSTGIQAIPKIFDVLKPNKNRGSVGTIT